MRILHLNDEPWDSGITAYSLQVAKNLKEAGHSVLFAARPGKKPALQAEALGLETKPITHPFDVLRLLRQTRWDVLNPHTGRTHSWVLGALKVLPGSKQAPVVRTRGDAKELKVNPISRLVYRNTAAVIAASDHIRKQYELGFGLNEEAARTIYPAVEVDEKVCPVPKRRVGLLGRLDPVKGHSVFLEAAAKVLAKLKDIEFVVAGKEAGLSVSLLRNQAKYLGIDSSVHFLGFQTSAKEFMRGCTVGVIASIGSEEVSRACLEWMSVGRPVVGTLVGSLPELIEPQETGLLVPTHDSVSMGEALFKIITNEKLANQFGKAAHTVAKRRFSPTVQTEKTLRVYDWVQKQ